MRRFVPLLAPLLLAPGCAAVAPTVPGDVPAGSVTLSGRTDAVWERTVFVLHEFGFRPVRESKLDGTIETDYVVGSGVLEPFRKDSVGRANRLEDTFQSTRRRVRARVVPGPGGHTVTVRAFKELEDVRGVAANTVGGATFQVNEPFDRELNLVVGQAGPTGWIPLGRDVALEGAILRALAGG